MPDRFLNYLFAFLLILFYIVIATSYEKDRMAIAFALATVVCLLALLMNWLSLDGSAAALITGTVALGLGGMAAAVILILFFSSSYLISLFPGGTGGRQQVPPERRDGRQVWANAFWFVLFLSLWFVTRETAFFPAAAASLAVAMADTWATEVGMRSNGNNTRLILNFSRVKPGTDGGISLNGTLAGLLGSLLLSIVYVLISGDYSLTAFFIIGIAGFSGCIVDSYLGAIFQTKNREVNLPESFAVPRNMSNNMVNVISTGFGAALTILIYWFII